MVLLIVDPLQLTFHRYVITELLLHDQDCRSIRRTRTIADFAIVESSYFVI